MIILKHLPCDVFLGAHGSYFNMLEKLETSMAIVWNLKKWLAVNRDIYRASELQLLIAEKAGVRLSLQAISAIINGQPSALRLQTIQALCDALDCS